MVINLMVAIPATPLAISPHFFFFKCVGYLRQRLEGSFCYLGATGEEKLEHVHTGHVEGVGHREKWEELVLLCLVVQHLCFQPTGRENILT